MSLAWASGAAAQCVATPAQPLNAITTDNTDVTCTGVNNGTVISANADNVVVTTRLFGSQFNNGAINVIGNGGQVFVLTSATTNGMTVVMVGNAVRLQVNDSINNGLSANLSGADVELRIGSGAIVTSTPGNLTLSSPAGSGGLFSLGGQIYSTGSAGSAFLINGGTGNQTFELLAGSTLSVQADGRAITGGAGDDNFIIEDGAFIGGGTGNNILFDGGNDNDSMTILGSGTANYNTVNIETLTIDAGAGGVRTLNGTHADLTQINLLSGSTNVSNFNALGVFDSRINVSAGANLNLLQLAPGAFDHVLAGSGTVTLNGGGGPISFGGTGSTFDGTFAINAGATAIIANEDALGTANFVNDGTVQFGGGIILDNDISGLGNVIKTGAGQSNLSGNNSYSGGTIVQSGQLNLTNGMAAGTGGVTVNAGAALNLDFVTDGSLGNDVTGAGVLVKSGNATVTLTGNNSYSGGTVLASGGLRVDNLMRLGTGPVTSNAGASLILNYNGAGQLLQTTPFFSGGGTFVKEGSGDIVMNAANNYTGGTVIRTGRIGLNTGDALGSGNIQIDSGGTLGIGGITLNNMILGSGRIVKTANNVATLSGDNSGFTGLFDIQAGSVVLQNGRSAGAGNVAIAAGTSLVVDSIVGDTVIAANLAGAGDLENLSNTRLTLTGTNSLTGQVFVTSGTLQIASGQNIGTADVRLTNASSVLNIATAANTTLANSISDLGRVVKTGSGTVTLTGANSYSGGTDIQQGALRVTNTNFLGTGAITVQTGAALDLSIAGQATLNLAISGGGVLRKTDGGTLTLLGNGLTGGLDIQAGSVNVATTSALGTGPVNIAAGASLNYNNSTAQTFGNALAGAGMFNKLGTGQLSFANNFSVGALNLNAGRTRINSIAATNVAVGANATLDGTGRIIGNLTNNGVVAPGNSIGTMTVQGNYVHGAGSVLEIEFDAAGNIDLLSVTGTATLNGGTLRFVSVGGAEGQGGTFLTAAGGLTGTFATIETVGAQLPLSVIYQANAGLMAPSVLTARPSTFNAQSLAAADATLAFVDSLGVADARHGDGTRIWMSGFGAWADRSASGTTLGYQHDTHGLSGGVNVDAGGGVTLGAAIGWTQGDITLASNGGGGDQTSILGAVTARYGTPGFSVAGGIVYGQLDQSTVRNVSFNGFSDSVNGETDSTLFAAFAEMSAPIGSVGGWSFAASTRGSYVRQSQDGYTESGTSPLRLRLDDINTSTIEGQAQLSARTRLWAPEQYAQDTDEGLSLRVDLGARYMNALGDRAIPVVFAASSAGIVLQGDTRSTVQGQYGAELEYVTGGGVHIGLGYRGETGRTDRHMIQGRVSFAF